jgi:2-dehydropantoate 2-reductase
LIVCVKQSHIASILPFIEQVEHETPVIFLQNGLGHIDVVKRLIQPVILGVVEHGALKQNDYTVSHTGKGTIYLAPYEMKANELTEKLVNAIHQPGFPVERKEDWYALLMNKLIINAVINPVTSLFGVKNKEIVKNSHITRIAKTICRETASVLQIEYDQAWERVQNVAVATGENTSSMLKDIQESRKTEIEGITGYILQNKKTDELPYSTFIYQSIKAIEEMKGIKK